MVPEFVFWGEPHLQAALHHMDSVLALIFVKLTVSPNMKIIIIYSSSCYSKPV